jgi:photosystem II stability/assembly factor-like uncharacterized protein
MKLIMHPRRFPVAWALSPLLISAVSAPAQRGPSQAQVQAQAPAGTLVRGLADEAVLGQLRFRSIGPAAMSGRVSDIAVAVPRDAGPGTRLGQVVYITTTGGAWKTDNGGKTWQSLTDDTPVHSAGAIAVTPTNPDVIWLGSGEANNLRSSSWGHGIYRSTDAGRTWTHMGLRESQHIARIVIHPTNPDIVYVAAMGPLWGAGGERGFYMTTDGGRTWTNTLARGPHTGVTDIAMDPSNPNTIYAATYQRDRRAWSFVAGGPESGIHKSTDGGRSWTALSAGLPTGEMGRIGLTIAASQPTTLYATVDAQDGGVYRSDDAGATWRRQSTLQSIPWFFGQIRVDPTNADRVYHLGVSLSASEDGGVSWRSIGNRTHADHHSMWIDPKDSNHLIIGNDGGLYISYDRGTTWDFAVNLPVSTFYTIAVDNRDPHYWVYGGLQDNGTFAGPASLRSRSGAVNTDWQRIGGGDGFHVLVDPQDTLTVYFESQNGALSRRDMATDESKSIRPAAEGMRLRYNWSAPLIISPHHHQTIYFGANVLFKSTDRGDSWTRVSDDLTRNVDRESLEIMGRTGPGGYRRHDGTADYGNLSTIAESPLRQGLIYVGTDDGLVQVTRDDGGSWRKIDTFPGVPTHTYVSRVIASQHHEATVYATFDGHRSNDFLPHVLKSTDYGQTWTSIAANLPRDASVQVIREHHRNPNLLFVGTENGVHVTIDGGQSWSKLGAGMPQGVPVHDLVIQERANDLLIGTHGRGLYVLDDITPLERLAEAAAARNGIAAFAPRRTHIYNPSGGPMTPGFRTYTSDNLPPGAIVNYYVAPTLAAGGTGTVVIRDAQGNVVRELNARLQPGVQRTRWDLRYQAAQAAAAQQRRAGDEEEEEPSAAGFGGGQAAGPYVFPGEYTVELRVQPASGQAITSERQRFTVLRDPVVRLSDAEYRTLHETRMRAYTLQRDAALLVTQLEAARGRISSALEGKADGAAGVQDGRQLLAELDAVLAAVRGAPAGGAAGRGGQGGGAAVTPVTTRAAAVANAIGTSHFMPTPDQYATLEAAETDFRQQQPRGAAAIGRSAAALQALGVR